MPSNLVTQFINFNGMEIRQRKGEVAILKENLV